MTPDGLARGRTALQVFGGIAVSFILLLVVLTSAVHLTAAATPPVVDPYLQEILPTADPDTPILVLLTFWRAGDRGLLDDVADHYDFRELPIASAFLTPAQILDLASWTQIRSIWFGLHMMPLDLAEGRALVQAPEANAVFGVTGAGVTVAVIDTGVDTLHPDFEDPSTGESRATNIEVDLGPAGTCTFVELPNTDDIGHGTHVSGTIAGNGALSDGTYAGIAPAARVVMYDTNAGLFIILFEAICAYDDILANQAATGIRHVSNSWGGGDGSFDRDDPIQITIKAVYDAGVVSVFAAGNSGPDDNTMSRQSVSPYVIGVAAITKKEQIVGFSSRGRPLDWPRQDPWPTTHDREEALAGDLPLFRPAVSAPGVLIKAPVPCSPACNADTGYGTMSGTSMATPHVSGVLALVLEMNPGLSARQMVGVIEGTAEELPEWLAWETGAGLVDALDAVGLAQALAADPSTPIRDPVLDERLDGTSTTRTNQGPVTIVGSASSANPGSCPTPSVCRDFIIVVPEGMTRLLVWIEWTTSEQNFYGFAFAPGQDVTDFPAQEDTGLLDIPINQRVLDIRMPAAGEWTIRVLPRVNVIDSVELAIFVSEA